MPENQQLCVSPFQNKAKNGRRCLLCPRQCLIKPGQKGQCLVRENRGDNILSLNYGQPVAARPDPVEKKPLYHFLPGTSIFSIGTVGCNLFCEFCQNTELSRGKPADFNTSYTAPAHIISAALEHNCTAIAFTYNEPTVYAEYAMEIARLAQKKDIRTAMVSSGYISSAARAKVYRNIDAFNVDLKAFTEHFYKKFCRGSLEPVLATMKYIVSQNKMLEITTLLLPGYNDSQEEIKKECQWIKANLGTDIPLHFSAFHPAYHFKNVPATPAATVKQAVSIARGQGLKFVYSGNVYDRENSSTYCPNCGALLIERNIYQTKIKNLQGSKCRKCGYRLYGVFKEE